MDRDIQATIKQCAFCQHLDTFHWKLFKVAAIFYNAYSENSLKYIQYVINIRLNKDELKVQPNTNECVKKLSDVFLSLFFVMFPFLNIAVGLYIPSVKAGSFSECRLASREVIKRNCKLISTNDGLAPQYCVSHSMCLYNMHLNFTLISDV